MIIYNAKCTFVDTSRVVNYDCIVFIVKRDAELEHQSTRNKFELTPRKMIHISRKVGR